MVDQRHRNVIASTPVNSTAGKVMSRGVHWESQRKEGGADHWKAPPPLVRMPKARPTFKDVTGREFGRMRVIGYLGRHKGKNSKGRWLVKCSCGDYEARSVKAITNPNNSSDMCVECRHLEYIKNNSGRGDGVSVLGKNYE